MHLYIKLKTQEKLKEGAFIRELRRNLHLLFQNSQITHHVQTKDIKTAPVENQRFDFSFVRLIEKIYQILNSEVHQKYGTRRSFQPCSRCLEL